MRNRAKASAAKSIVAQGTIAASDRPSRAAFPAILVLCLSLLALAAFPPPALSASRVYEKVSPADKNALDIVPYGLHASAASGDRVVFGTLAAAPGASAGTPSNLISTRDSGSGWLAHPIAPPGGAGVSGYSSDLSKALLNTSNKLTPDATAEVAQLYVADLETGSYELVTPEPSPPQKFTGYDIGAASEDLAHLAYESRGFMAQTAEPITGEINVYEWVNGVNRLVGLLPNGDPAPNGSRLGSGPDFGTTEHAMSRDGTRIFFHNIEVLPTAGNSSGGQIYSRENGTGTTHVSASQRSDCADDPIDCGGDGLPDPSPDPAGPLPAAYWTAESEHGSTVLFTSCEKLTDDSTAGVSLGQEQPCVNSEATHQSGTLAGRDLYLYDFDANEGTGELMDLTTDDPNGARVFGVVGASDQLDRIYFVAAGILAAGATDGARNLYLWETDTTRFIASLDELSSTPSGKTLVLDQNNWALKRYDGNKAMVTRITPDGKHLLFTSRARLTSYDNSNPLAPECRPFHIFSGPEGEPDGNPEGLCAQVYLYDSVLDKLSCLSCSPTGAPPAGDAQLQPSTTLANLGTPNELTGNLRADGRQAFFETPTKLVAGDTNGKIDVYEWEDGQISLISNGRGGSDSHFADATPSGSDVFFLTRDRLLASDLDGNLDMYDARVGGTNFDPPPLTPTCEGDACLAPPLVPNDPTPSSSTFSGTGNPSHLRKRCRQGSKLRRGRCVKKGRSRKSSRRSKRTDGGHR